MADHSEHKGIFPSCAICHVPVGERACIKPEGKAGKGCPTLIENECLKEALEVYREPIICEFARQASIQEGECYEGRGAKDYVLHPVKPRILEICEFARKMGYEKLGLAFCVGLTREAAIVSEIFTRYGFEVVSVVCKVGAVPKEEIGIKEAEKIYVGTFEAMCNPIAQAEILNRAEVDFNVALGLCVGHDSLFFRHARAPVTVLAVKDRVTGHNPLSAVYTYPSYFRWLGKSK